MLTGIRLLHRHTFIIAFAVSFSDDPQVRCFIRDQDEFCTSHLFQSLIDVSKVVKLRLHLESSIVAPPIKERRLSKVLEHFISIHLSKYLYLHEVRPVPVISDL